MINFIGIFKDIKNIIMLVLLVFCIYLIVSKNMIKSELNNLSLQYNNQIALSDSLRIIGDNLYQKYALLETEDNLNKIAKKELEKELKKSTTSVTILNTNIKNLENTIKKLQKNPQIDTVFVNGIQYQNYSYNYSDIKNEYSINGNISVLSGIEPKNVDFNYNIKFKPIDVSIITQKNSDYSYSITVKSNSNIFIINDIKAYLPAPITQSNKPFYKKINFSIGAGITQNGLGYVITGGKYSKNLLNITYAGGNNGFGLSYQRFLINE